MNWISYSAEVSPRSVLMPAPLILLLLRAMLGLVTSSCRFAAQLLAWRQGHGSAAPERRCLASGSLWPAHASRPNDFLSIGQIYFANSARFLCCRSSGLFRASLNPRKQTEETIAFQSDVYHDSFAKPMDSLFAARQDLGGLG